MIRYILITLVVLDYLWQIFGVYLSSKQMKKPLPACVRGIYDDEQYARWVAYTHEKRRFNLITGGLSTALVVAVFALDLLAWIHGLVGVGGRLGDAIMIAVLCLVASAADIIPNYVFTFRIEEKYGFNTFKETQVLSLVEYCYSFYQNFPPPPP